MALFDLQFATPPQWLDVVLADFDLFLADHATAEKKASGMAMSMVSHYPDRPELVAAMIDLAIEELQHFREVSRLLYQRGQQLLADDKDPYVNQLRKLLRKQSDHYLLDRLLSASIIEKRGYERFAMVADGVQQLELQQFYSAIARSEERHYELFYQLALGYFAEEEVAQRTQQLLLREAEIVAALPFRAALH